MKQLRELDEELLPRLAARARRLADSATRRRERVVASAGGVREALAAAPRELDRRYAGSGPLALLRDVPQLGLLLVAVLFASGSGLALVRSGEQAQLARQRAEERAAEAQLPLVLGPQPGTSAERYVDDARRRAVELSRQAPERRYLALVSLNRALTVDEAEQVAGDLDVEMVLLRAAVPGTPELVKVRTADRDLSDLLRERYAALVKEKREDQAEFQRLADSIQATTKEEEAFQAFYVEAARTSGRESAAYRAGCRCVIALLVRAQAKRLAELPAMADVRAVEPARLGAELAAVTVSPLLPGTTGVVPALPGGIGGTGG